jgi:hypothetical protein
MNPLVILMLVVAATAPGARTAKVTYLAGGSVYVGAGRAEGIAVGDTLELIDDAGVAGLLRVAVVSTRSAACDTFQMRALPVIGQAVRYRPRTAPDSTATGGAPVPTAAGAVAADPARRAAGPPMLRGRIGVGWDMVDAEGPAGRTERPALDVRLDGRAIGGAPVDAAVDLRSRRVYRRDTTSSPESEFVSRLWRGSVTVHDRANRARLTAGRQSATAFSAVSLFDGGLFEWNTARWGLAAFGGTQPEPSELAFSSDIAEFGVYAERRAPAGGVRSWSLGLGAITSQQEGEPNRDFLFAQGFWRAPGTFVTLLQEVDVNRGWRADGASTLSATSTFLSASVMPMPALTLRAGYDGRRSVRLWRDRLTPETEFDDRFRQGAWAGAGWDALRALRVEADVRQRFGSDAQRSTTWGAGVQGRWAGTARPIVAARYAENRNLLTLTRLVSGSFGVDPLDGTHVEVSGGWRSDGERVTGEALHTTWGALDLDVVLALRWHLLASYALDRGDTGPLDQAHLALSWRF